MSFATLIAVVLILLGVCKIISENKQKGNRKNSPSGNTTKSTSHSSSSGTPGDSKVATFCPKCKATLRVPRNIGTLEVTCPQCGNKFLYTPPVTKPVGNPAPKMEAAPAYTSTTEELPPNELGAWVPGSIVWVDPDFVPATAHETLRNLFAAKSAAFIIESFKTRSDLRCVRLRYSLSLVIFELYLTNTSTPDETVTDNCLRELEKINTSFHQEDETWMYRRTFSQLVKELPGVYKHHDKIYRSPEHYRLYK